MIEGWMMLMIVPVVVELLC